MKLKYYTLTQFQESVFDVFMWISYILLVVSAFGFSQSAPKYLYILDYSVRTYICLFLIWRFNPWRQEVLFNSLDRTIAFNAGLFILTSAVLNEYLQPIENKVKANIRKTVSMVDENPVPSSIYS